MRPRGAADARGAVVAPLLALLARAHPTAPLFWIGTTPQHFRATGCYVDALTAAAGCAALDDAARRSLAAQASVAAAVAAHHPRATYVPVHDLLADEWADHPGARRRTRRRRAR